MKQYIVTIEYESPIQTMLGLKAESPDEAVKLVLEGVDTSSLPNFRIISVEEDLAGEGSPLKAESKLAIN